MHFKGCHCDNTEGNLCQPCEQEVKEVKREASDPWAGFGQRKEGQWSINAGSSGTVAEGYMYV